VSERASSSFNLSGARIEVDMKYDPISIDELSFSFV
jgi:hypothetical protein